ncbi:hypothetical protein ACIPSA_27850 [Streptomyces sp. NPDC086549]|uniref:hypothetical protein n=1 Tax=Streptomyces sp. NPDC086549 TaxID=3365752 RepID=UPI00381A7C2B
MGQGAALLFRAGNLFGDDVAVDVLVDRGEDPTAAARPPMALPCPLSPGSAAVPTAGRGALPKHNDEHGDQ